MAIPYHRCRRCTTSIGILLSMTDNNNITRYATLLPVLTGKYWPPNMVPNTPIPISFYPQLNKHYNKTYPNVNLRSMILFAFKHFRSGIWRRTTKCWQLLTSPEEITKPKIYNRSARIIKIWFILSHNVIKYWPKRIVNRITAAISKNSKCNKN